MKKSLIRDLARSHFAGVTLLMMFVSSAGVAAETLTLHKAEQVALLNEPGVQGLNAKTQSYMETSIAEGRRRSNSE